jgi:hypothetical protein
VALQVLLSVPKWSLIGARYYMKASAKNAVEQEPIGIVISRGSRHEHVPVVSAYVWGPVPEATEEPRETKAA